MMRSHFYLKILLIAILTLLIPAGINAQVTQEWVAQYNQDTVVNVASDMEVDENGNVYVTGYTYRIDSKYDFLTIKYSPTGEILWKKYFDGGNHDADKATTIKLDHLGNIYIAGTANSADIAIIKYNQNGSEIWIKYYGENNNKSDIVSKKGLLINSNGDIYISVGTSFFSVGFITLKFNSDGILLWEKLFVLNEQYNPIAMSFDNEENILVAGSGYSNTNRHDFALIKYNYNGDSIWTARYNSPNNGSEYCMDMFIDKSDNVYLTGNISENPNNIADVLTIKYDSSGSQEWINRYNGSGGFRDLAEAIAVDDSENVYILGHSFPNETTDILSLLCLDRFGNVVWSESIGESTTSPPFGGFTLKIDGDGFIYASGIIRGDSSSYDYIIQKFDAKGSDIWNATYDNNFYVDFAADLEIDKNGNVYITGNSLIEEPSINTIKYSQTIGINPISSEIPSGYSLPQNYPNPFNPYTKIKFDIPKASLVRLTVYDILGRQVAELVNQNLNAGTFEYEWSGAELSSGIYFYKLEAGDFVETRRMVLVK